MAADDTAGALTRNCVSVSTCTFIITLAHTLAMLRDNAGSVGRYFLTVIRSLACVKFLAIRCSFFFFHTTLHNGSLKRVLFWAKFLANPLKAVMLITVKITRSINGNHFFINTTSFAYTTPQHPKLISRAQ
jgi:hypothetical protein